jgi:hypothetical protein
MTGPICEPLSVSDLDDELFDLLHAHVPAGAVIETLSNRRPNWVTEVTREGVLIETERSRAHGAGAQLVPAWMIQAAWDHLRAERSLTNKYLLAADGLNVKRSAAVCALLAALPGVEVKSTRPIVLVFT